MERIDTLTILRLPIHEHGTSHLFRSFILSVVFGNLQCRDIIHLLLNLFLNNIFILIEEPGKHSNVKVKWWIERQWG